MKIKLFVVILITFELLLHMDMSISIKQFHMKPMLMDDH